VAARPRGWRVYILRCGDGTLYTGATNDLARRLSAPCVRSTATWAVRTAAA